MTVNNPVNARVCSKYGKEWSKIVLYLFITLLSTEQKYKSFFFITVLEQNSSISSKANTQTRANPFFRKFCNAYVKPELEKFSSLCFPDIYTLFQNFQTREFKKIFRFFAVHTRKNHLLFFPIIFFRKCFPQLTKLSFN